MSLASLITYAYSVDSFQVTGPEWTNADRFDIEATFPNGAEKKDVPRMMQALLKDRFKLSFHVEKRELEGYALIVGKRGEKLRPSAADPVSSETTGPAETGERSAGERPARSRVTSNPDGSSTVDMGKRGTQTTKFDLESWSNHLERSRMTMEELAGALRNCVGGGDHGIVDETGIKGAYQVAYDCPMSTPRPRAGGDAGGTQASDPQGGSLLNQSLEALGLKLEKRKMLQDVYVIDHAERPSEN